MILDVGANDGRTFVEDARAGCSVYLFEPTPVLISQIKGWIGEFPSMTLVEAAVSETDGEATFNIAGQYDWGCSSLLQFSDGLEETWPGRTDLVVTDRINVKTMRLDTFLNMHPEITSIDWLHIDAQGSDLAVLRSLGDKLSIVKGGFVEVPQSRDVMLYKDQHTKEEMLKFLHAGGFEVIEVWSQMNEDNLKFRRLNTC